MGPFRPRLGPIGSLRGETHERFGHPAGDGSSATLQLIADLRELQAELPGLTRVQKTALRVATAKLLDSEEDLRIRLAVATALEPATPLEERLGKALEAILSFDWLAVQAKGGVFRVDPAQRELRLIVTRGDFDPAFFEREQRIPIGHCLCGRAAETGQFLQSGNCFTDTWHDNRYPGMTSHGHYIVPLQSGGVVRGILFLYTDPCPKWVPERLTTLREIGLMIGTAMHRDEATQLATARQTAATLNLEINGALQSILGAVDHLLRAPDLPEPLADIVRSIDTACERIADTVKHIEGIQHVATTRASGQMTMLDLTKSSPPVPVDQP